MPTSLRRRHFVFLIREPQRAALEKSAAAAALVESFIALGKRSFYDPERSYVCVVGARDERTYLALDERGRILQTQSPMGRRTAFQFDGEKLVAAVGTSGRLVRFIHSGDGRRTNIQRSDGSVEAVELDGDGNFVCYTLSDGSSLRVTRCPQGVAQIIDRAGGVTRRAYDESGALSSITDATGRVTRLKYGISSRPEGVEYPDGTFESYEYEGTVIRQTVNGTPHAEYQTSVEGRLVEGRYADRQAFKLEYGAGGKVVAATSDDAVVRCVYDDHGRILSEDQDGRTVRYAYNADGQLTSLTLPDGQSSAYEYDLDGRLTAVMDWRGGVQRFSYGAAPSPASRELPSRLSERHTSDALGRTAAIELVGERGSVWCQRYQYDSVDRVICREDSRCAERRYQYDRAGHLVSVWDARSGAALERYGYDVNENRVSCQRGSVANDTRDQVTDDGHFLFRYDPHGNRIERTSVDAVTRYSYGRQNLLLTVTRADGSIVKFGYDAFGRRISKQTESRKITYIWAGNNVVQEYIEEAGVVTTREFLFVPGTYRPLALQDRNGIAFFHCDHLGTPQLLTNGQGRIVWSGDYESYGRATLSVQEVDQPLRLPGQYYDAETGLHYNRARYYDPTLGRYLCRDPLAPVAGVNPYLYAGGNPVNQSDPLGLWGESWPGWVKTTVAIAGAVVAGAAVAAAVIVLAPALGVAAGVAGIAALAAGGLAAGAVGGGLNAAMTPGGCVPCAMLRGAALGLLGAALFLAAPELELGIAGVAAVGAVVSGATYLADVVTSDRKFKVGDLAEAMAIGAVLAPVGEWLGGVFVEGLGGNEPGAVAYRGDDNPYSPAGRKPGSTKSHINPDGEIEPANPNGSATPVDHVAGREPLKSDSPYTSFKEDPSTGKAFGAQESQVDVTRLQNDIASGKVKDVEVIDHDDLMAMHDQNVADKQSQYDADPSPANERQLADAQRIRDYSARDTEMLIKGTIPSEYVTPPGAQPADSPPPIAAPPLRDDDQ